MKTSSLTREQWLLAATDRLRPFFKGKGHEIPVVRVSTGWPSRKALSVKSAAIGQYWDKAAASDKVGQIFISPLLDQGVDKEGQGVLPVLIHECIHAVFGSEEGHGSQFGRLARSLGLEGKLTATHAGEECIEICNRVLDDLGAYPHSRLNPTVGGPKKQGTRMIKCECVDCGYTVRTTQKWLDEKGAPLCPCNEETMTVALPGEK